MVRVNSHKGDEALREYQEDFDARVGERRIAKWKEEIKQKFPEKQINRSYAAKLSQSGSAVDHLKAGQIYVALGDYEAALPELYKIRKHWDSLPSHHADSPNELGQEFDSRVDALEAIVNQTRKKSGRKLFGIFGAIILIASVFFSADSLTGFTISESISQTASSLVGILLFVAGFILTYSFLRSRRN